MTHTVPAPDGRRLLDALLLGSFLVSGWSALAYQVAWQRALYGIVGVDIDSVTIIVSVFMLGIGAGGLLGGWLADRFPIHRLTFYGVAEVSIALYGAISLSALATLDVWMLAVPPDVSRVAGSMASFLFFLVPTLLMGMTLPLLTLAFNEHNKNIGVSVGTLYFINTLGAAMGAASVPLLLLPIMTLSQVIWCAVVGNLCVALLVLLATSAKKMRGCA